MTHHDHCIRFTTHGRSYIRHRENCPGLIDELLCDLLRVWEDCDSYDNPDNPDED